jgi:hypothetical protein
MLISTRPYYITISILIKGLGTNISNRDSSLDKDILDNKPLDKEPLDKDLYTKEPTNKA